MKVYAVIQTTATEVEGKVKIRGIFSTETKAIDFVNQIDLTDDGEMLNFFSKEDFVMDNHNNGYLRAYLEDDYAEFIIDTYEIEVDNETIIREIFNVI